MNLNEPANPSVPPSNPDPVPRVPDPGSGAALAGGCTCATVENTETQRPPLGWHITRGCPLHWPAEGGAAA